MRMQGIKVVIAGMRKFKDQVEGKEYDTTKVYIEESFAPENVNGRGSATVEYAAGKSDVFDRLKDQVFPMQAEVDLDTITNGKLSKVVVMSIRPIAAPRTAGVLSNFEKVSK